MVVIPLIGWALFCMPLMTLAYHHFSPRFSQTALIVSRADKVNLSPIYAEGSKEWWDADEDDDLVYLSDENKACMQGGDLNLFDQLPDRQNWFGSLGQDGSSLSMQSLREISESYLFSLSFLGDYVVQLGVRPPIDVDARVGDLLTSAQAFSLLEALTSLDPYESNIEYDSVTAEELAYELELPTEKFCYICDAERLNLPFGMGTVLHQSVVDKIREVADFDEYRNIADSR